MAQYVVKSGDTLSAIGAKYGVPYQQITGYRSGNPSLIYPGEVLTVPDKSVPAPSKTPAPVAAPTPAPAPTPQPAPAVAVPTPQPPASPTVASGGPTPPPYDPNVVNQTVSYGGATWKGNPGTGWTIESQAGSAAVPGGTAPTVTGFSQPTIDLPKLYQGLYDTSGVKSKLDIVTQKQTELSNKEKEFIEAKGKLNDNPFLSEATRVGRQAKLEQLFNERTANLRTDIQMASNDVATSKADLETQLNIQTKQFDINSQQAQLALSQFNVLLQAGAFNNASGEDIASITRATGLSSSVIQGAVAANKAKDVKTSVIQYDDGTNQGFAVINANTGEIVSKQVVAASKPKEPTATKPTQSEVEGNRRGKASQLLEKYKNAYGHVSYQIWQQILAAFIQDGGTRDEFIKNFAQYTDPNRGDFETTYGFSQDKR